MALILHLDTSRATGIAMLSLDGIVLSVEQSEGERNHAGNINTLVEKVIGKAGKVLTDIDAIAVCNGPGSYTGLRIGLATAKGFCFALQRPLLLNNRLQLMLLEARAEVAGMKNYLALLPARTGEYYGARYCNDIYLAPGNVLLDEAADWLGNGVETLLIGIVNEDMREVLQAREIRIISHNELNMHSWAAVVCQDFNSEKFADIAYSTPDYLKSVYINQAPDNKIKKMDR